MEVVQAKFDNFKKFVSESAPNAWLLNRLLETDLREFLATISEKLAENLTTDEIVEKVLGFAWVSPGDFSTAQLDKFKLYIEYFRDVALELRK